MKISHLRLIADMEAGVPVPAVNAVLKKVFDPREGMTKANPPKPYKYQDVILEQDGVEVKATLSDCDTIPGKKKGDKVVINCDSNKHGLTGVKTKWDDYIPDRAPEGYKGQMILWITPSAQIAYEGTGGSSGGGDGGGERQQSGGGSSSPKSDAPAGGQQQRQTDNKPKSKAEALGLVKKVIARASNIMVLAVEGAHYAVEMDKKVAAAKKVDPIIKDPQTLATTLFIEACRNGAMNTMPVVDLRTFDPAADQQNAEEAEKARKAKEDAERAERERIAKEEEEKKKRAAQQQSTAARSHENLDDDVPF